MFPDYNVTIDWSVMNKAGWTPTALEIAFKVIFGECLDLMLAKNADYGNSWYDDRDTTITDTIRHKIDRIRNLEDLRARGETPKVSEGIEQELIDIINWSVFRLIKLRELESKAKADTPL